MRIAVRQPTPKDQIWDIPADQQRHRKCPVMPRTDILRLPGCLVVATETGPVADSLLSDDQLCEPDLHLFRLHIDRHMHPSCESCSRNLIHSAGQNEVMHEFG
jgi:hypothetical protein